MRERIVDWIRARRPGTLEIPAHADLMQTGLINSLEMMEFLVFLEELAGREIDLEATDAGLFRTIESIESLLGAATDTPGPR